MMTLKQFHERYMRDEISLSHLKRVVATLRGSGAVDSSVVVNQGRRVASVVVDPLALADAVRTRDKKTGPKRKSVDIPI